VTLKPGLGSLRVIGTDTDRSAAYDFLLMFHSNHGPISYSFRDKRLFPWKTANFSHIRVFCAHTEGFPGNWVSALGVKKTRGHRANAARKKSDVIFSRLDTRHQRDGRTDRHRATAKTALMHSVAR